MSLVGNTYIQTSDPGAVGAGYWWYNNTTGEAKSRNSTNTGWIDQGNWDYSHSGNLPLTGGSMTGPIMTTGVSSWAPIASPNFSGTPQKSGIALATTTDLSTAISSLQGNINNLISQAIASTSASITIGNNVAWGMGYANHGDTIVLPSYANGDAATSGEIVLKLASVRQLATATVYNGLSYEWITVCYLDGLNVVCYSYKSDSGVDQRTGSANYIVVCAR